MTIVKKITLLIAFVLFNTGFSQYTEVGVASFYADKFEGRNTANGEVFSQLKMTAAHRTLPFGSKVKVTNTVNKKAVIVVINDRGPFSKDRIIDLSLKGAKMLDFVNLGKVKVKLELLNPNVLVSDKVITEPKKSSQPVTSKDNTEKANASAEYYKIHSELLKPKGFGVQVASFKEAANLIKKFDLIKKQSSKDVFVKVGVNNGAKVYQIVIGSFETMSDARKYNNKLQDKFPGSFVVTF